MCQGVLIKRPECKDNLVKYSNYSVHCDSGACLINQIWFPLASSMLFVLFLCFRFCHGFVSALWPQFRNCILRAQLFHTLMCCSFSHLCSPTKLFLLRVMLFQQSTGLTQQDPIQECASKIPYKNVRARELWRWASIRRCSTCKTAREKTAAACGLSQDLQDTRLEMLREREDCSSLWLVPRLARHETRHVARERRLQQLVACPKTRKTRD